MKKRELQKIVETSDDIKSGLRWAEHFLTLGLPAGPVLLTVGRPRRSLDQNAKLWPMLADISKQVEWHGLYLSKEDWKDMFTASLEQQRSAPGIDGGFVIFGTRTSKMGKAKLAELIELMYAFGAEHDVVWTDPKEVERLRQEHVKRGE